MTRAPTVRPGSARRRRGRRTRVPGPATAEALEAAAARYVARYASAAENLRRVLMRRVERSARDHGTERSEGADIVAGIVARYAELGLVDDRAYAEALARRLHQRGVPPVAIRARLAQKGLARETAAEALAAIDAEVASPELAAACRLARRRRLGPYRPEAARTPRRDKDLAALARAGFSLEVARRVVDAESAEAVQAICDNLEGRSGPYGGDDDE